MKHFIFIFSCLFFWSCGSGGEEEPIPPAPDEKPVINIPSTDPLPVIEQKGGKASLSFTTNTAWTATVNAASARSASWVSVLPESGGAGSHTLTFGALSLDESLKTLRKMTLSMNAMLRSC